MSRKNNRGAGILAGHVGIRADVFALHFANTVTNADSRQYVTEPIKWTTK